MPKNEMYDVGEDRRDTAEPISSPAAKKYYPSLSINDTILPLLKDRETGDVFQLNIEVRVTGIREPDEWESYQKGKMVSLDIKKIGEPGSSQKT